MRFNRSIFLAALCGLALAGAGCGDDDENQALSYEETGTEIGQICTSVDEADSELNGQAKNDAPKLPALIEKFEGAIEDIRDLEVNEELEADRDAFVENAEQLVGVFTEAQAVAETGNTKAYRRELEKSQPISEESDEIASRLGADACIDE